MPADFTCLGICPRDRNKDCRGGVPQRRRQSRNDETIVHTNDGFIGSTPCPPARALTISLPVPATYCTHSPIAAVTNPPAASSPQFALNPAVLRTLALLRTPPPNPASTVQHTPSLRSPLACAPPPSRPCPHFVAINICRREGVWLDDFLVWLDDTRVVA